MEGKTVEDPIQLEDTLNPARDRVHTHFSRPDWTRVRTTWCKGKAWDGLQWLEASQWEERLRRQPTLDLSSFFAELNGFFAIVHGCHDRWCLAVDAIRSIPLFYSVIGGNLYITDDAHWLYERWGNPDRDLLATEEFLLTGYVTGRDTLYPEIKQVQAGEVVQFQVLEGAWMAKPEQYHRYRHGDDLEGDENTLRGQFDTVVLSIFQRFLAAVEGRTVVIPLSSGYDSRFIALMLKRLGYHDVIAFNYGPPGSKESEISRQVAESLGFPWLFVPYRHADWYHWFRTDEYRSYVRMADGLCTVPHEQDWPAVWQLQRNKWIPADAVFAPGHSADMLTGSRSGRVPELYRMDAPKRSALIEVLRLHYCLQEGSLKIEQDSNRFLDRIQSVVGDLDDYPEAAGILESWEVQERQAKYIVNAVRVYEFWGYQWWLPFWDLEFMGFWRRVPLRFRCKQAFYRAYVEALYREIAGVDLSLSRASDKRGVRHALGRMIRTFALGRSLRLSLARSAVWRSVIYDQDPIFGIVPKSLYLKHPEANSLLAFEALEQLGMLSLDENEGRP